ncbi:hypothetical protein WJX82_004424 [Trebouxia sp. C0006]
MKRQVSSFSCKALAGANSLSKVMTGFTAAGASNYRPFGEYVMCTSNVLREHSIKRYMAAVQHIDLASPAWKQASAFFPDARNVIEFGYVKLLQDGSTMDTTMRVGVDRRAQQSQR